MTEWWRPENLARLEAEFREDPERFGQNDFWSYRRIEQGATPYDAALHVHNDLRFPSAKIKAVASVVDLGTPGSMLDAGCGAGFMSAAMVNAFPAARVVGVDVSHDAVAYATRQHPGATFVAATLGPESPPVGSFDLIWCIDFYPFTRNADGAYQAEFARSLVAQLNPGGRLLIIQSWTIPRSMASCFDDVVRRSPDLSFTRVLAPHPRLASRMPAWLAIAASRIGTFVARRELVLPIVVVTRRAG